MIKNKSRHIFYNRMAMRTALIYIVLSALWIVFSDRLLLTNPATTIYISTLKGWIYTIVIGIYLYFTIAKEIIKINEANEVAKKAELLLRSSIESQKDINIFSVSKNYEYLYFNQAHAQRMKRDYGQEIKLGMNILDVITVEKNRKNAKAELDRALNGESFTKVQDFGQEEKTYYEGTLNPIINENKEVIGATIIAKDITVRTRSEEAIQASEEKYRLLFSHMINGFAYHKIITDENQKPIDYEFIEINSAFRGIIGLGEREIVGKRVTEVIPNIEDDPADWIRRYGEVALTGKGIVFRNYSVALDKWFNVSAYSPKHGYFATIFEDISSLKKNEERLRELNKLKDDFLSMTTHELRTPLIPIKSQAQLLLAGDYGVLNEEQRKAIEMIHRNEENLNKLTSDILYIAKIKSHKFKLSLSKSSMHITITTAVDELRCLAQEKNISLILKPMPEIPLVMIDQPMMAQAIINLLSNAIKFTPKNGQISLEVKSINQEIIVAIKDNGIGISAEKIGQLFTPFFQIDSSLSREYPGVGLGLVISKGIIEAHGGRIWVESEGEGKGSTFYFSVPFNI